MVASTATVKWTHVHQATGVENKLSVAKCSFQGSVEGKWPFRLEVINSRTCRPGHLKMNGRIGGSRERWSLCLSGEGIPGLNPALKWVVTFS